MFTLLLSDTPTLSTSNSAILIASHHNRFKPRSPRDLNKPRSQATFNTKSYNDGLQRAFNKAKLQVYFNPDMDNFITLTYRGIDHTPEDVIHDIKMLIKRETRQNDRSFPAGSGQKTLKYIWIMEYQERGSIHVHMIANNSFSLQVNKNGYNELKYWSKGFSSVLHITDFDNNFRPYLYLFKYMRKAQRIGKSFVHSSRNLNNFFEITDEKLDINFWDTKNQERTETHINDLHLYFYKYYLKRVTISPQLNLEESYDNQRNRHFNHSLRGNFEREKTTI